MALLHVNFFSDVLGMATSMDVILPEQTMGQIGMEGRASDKPYPTLYLLHGMSDDHTIWQRRTSIERYVSDMGIAVVMPTTHLGWYTDMAQGNRYWTFISEELPAKCRSFFKNMSDRREDTFAAGLSMGGYGALVHGLSQSQRFAAIGSFSGAAKVCDDREFQFSPAKLAEACAREDRKKPMYIACGDQDFLYQDNIAFKDYLEKLGFDVTWVVGEGYTHEWRFWNREVEAFLDWIPRTDAYYNGGEKRKI